MKAIYLDHNATTPVDPQVLEAMLPYLREEFGNPSSAYPLGRRAHAAVEYARTELAGLIGALPDEIVFTSGATEATNIAIRGAVALDRSRTGIVTTNIEHPATDACCRLLERAGHPVERVPASRSGIVASDRVAAMVGQGTAVAPHVTPTARSLRPSSTRSVFPARRGWVQSACRWGARLHVPTSSRPHAS
jgi:cysteine desulfurase